MKNHIIRCLLGVTVYAFFGVLLFFFCRHRLCMLESFGTFYYDWHLIADSLSHPGGVAEQLSLFFLQFFTSGIVAVLITALLLTLAAAAVAAAMRSIGSPQWLLPLALLPSVAMVYLLGDIDARYSGIVAYLLMTTALALTVRMRGVGISLAVSGVVSLLLYYLCGPVALLYAVIMMVIELVKRSWRGVYWLLCPLLVVGAAYLSVTSGWYADMSRALSPSGYYTLWMQAPSVVYLTWLTALAVFVLACLASVFKSLSQSVQRFALGACLCLVVAFAAYGYIKYSNADDELFAELMTDIGHADWESVSQRCQGVELDDLRLQNCLTLALAERQQLGKVLFQLPCNGRATLIDMSQKSPAMFMLFSDIYYAMGHLSLAQKYAFEANEAMGNMSPRLLKRLADVSIATGQYAVAEKYLKLLSATGFYADWAHERSLLLGDDAAVAVHPELGAKRACLSVSDSFAGSDGIEADLAEILRVNPSHAATMQYLGSMLLLDRNVPAFRVMVDEFYGTQALPSPLPKHFQEGIAIAALATGERCDIMYGLHPSVVERCQAFWSKRQDQPSTFWHYLRFGKRPQ